MDLQIAGTNIEIAPAVRSYIERKLGKLSRHLSNIIETKVEVSEEKTRSPDQHYLVRVTVHGGHSVFHGEERAEDLFATIDKVAATMVRQLDDFKGKKQDKRRRGSSVRVELATPPPEPTGKVVKVKQFVLKPMTLAEAIEQMEILGHDFFLFYRADSERGNLVYRRKDGNYGRIETWNE